MIAGSATTCQRVAHSHYPAYLWTNDERYALKNPPQTRSRKTAGRPDPNDRRSYAGFTGAEYGMDIITDQGREFIRDNKDRPFSFIPDDHSALLAASAADSLEEYKDAFSETRISQLHSQSTPRAVMPR